MKRLGKILWTDYKFYLFFVVVGIIGSAVATVTGTVFIKTLIDSYIMPMLSGGSSDFTALFAALTKLAAIFAVGVVCAYMYNRLMVSVGQGVMRTIRNDLFTHMESLPIGYFDSHSHGDIMSIYTNDTDTMRQFVGQSLPQLSNSVITLISVFISMIIMDIPLTVISLIMVCLLLMVSKKIVGNSRKYFVRQQKDIGSLNGYVEEMVNGQKVIKVFNHEEKAIKEFKMYNETLKESSYMANLYANIIIPVSAQIGNISYVVCAIVGSVLAINGYTAITLGTLVSFLTLNKNFNQPIAQVSNQLGSVAMAMAGMKRIFGFMDEKVESDEGHVLLVNVKYEMMKL